MYFWTFVFFLYCVKWTGASFLSQPTNATIRIGDSVLIDCKIEHDDISNRTWYINGSFTDQNYLPTGIFSRVNGLYIAGKYSKYYNQATFQCSYEEQLEIHYSRIGKLTVEYSKQSITISITTTVTATTLPNSTNELQRPVTNIHYRYILLIVGVTVIIPSVILLIIIYLLVAKRKQRQQHDSQLHHLIAKESKVDNRVMYFL